MSGPVLVTGAGGFIGRAVVAALGAAGVPVRAGARRPAPGAVSCDLDRPPSVAAACASATAVVHAAGRAVPSMRGHLRALLDAAAAAGVARVVLLSSVAVYGARAGLVREDDPLPEDGDRYGAAKRACEAMLGAWLRADPGRRAVVLRPGIVYGRGSDLWIERPAALLRAGALGDLGPRGDGLAALVHVADAAEAVRRALRHLDGPGPAATAVNVVGPEVPTWNAYHAALAARIGVPFRAIGPARLAAARALAAPAKLAARLGLPSPPALRLAPSAGELRLYASPARYAADRAEGVLGFRATTGLARGLDLSLPPRAGAAAPDAPEPARPAAGTGRISRAR